MKKGYTKNEEHWTNINKGKEENLRVIKEEKDGN